MQTQEACSDKLQILRDYRLYSHCTSFAICNFCFFEIIARNVFVFATVAVVAVAAAQLSPPPPLTPVTSIGIAQQLGHGHGHGHGLLRSLSLSLSRELFPSLRCCPPVSELASCSRVRDACTAARATVASNSNARFG